MQELTEIFWPDLFASKSAPDFRSELQVVRKSGTPFLFLPLSASLAASSLALYPAQTRLAKLAKSLLRAALRSRLPVPLEKTSLVLCSQEPFARFLGNLADVPAGNFPPVAILCGNIRAAGRRFILLIFDEKGRAKFVVKAGVRDSARQLIRHEASFLHSAPPDAPGLPLLRASFDAGEVSAFALDFVDGDSPKPAAWTEAGELLSAWVDHEKQVQLRDTAEWQALAQTLGTDPSFSKLSQKLADVSFRRTMVHGDFAPWNIKVTPHGQTWRVLDWERGSLAGVPGWDWFHYVIQSGALIQKLSPEQLAANIEELLNHAAFQKYAGLAGIRQHERLLVLAYLFYLIHVIGPSEGLETNQSLLALLLQRWLA